MRNCFGFSCFLGESLHARLSNAVDNTTYFGKVELLYNGTWTKLCFDGWNKKHAQVLCRQLGYLSVVQFTKQLPARSGKVPQASLHGLSCYGDETNIAFCNGTIALQGMCKLEGHVSVECGEGKHNNCMMSRKGVQFIHIHDRCCESW